MPAPASPDALTGAALDDLARRTREHYAARAIAFRDGTADHDVSQNIDALLRHLNGPRPWSILDFGCGPGRDLVAFRARGHEAVGLEGVGEFAAMARAASGCEVWEQDFLRLDLPRHRFDGVFANASLFHVPRQALPRVLRELFDTLKPGGVLMSSNPRGDDTEGWSAGRYGAWHSLEGWRAFMRDAGFVELEHYYRPPGLPREQQPWLASVWRAGRGP